MAISSETSPDSHSLCGGASTTPYASFQVHRQPGASSASPSTTTTVVVKAKRRRTRHDHAILEAAYQNNSKPDKNERAEIVARVGLGEKEVQIWFQNRRQNDRRRSKPLEPHELIAHIHNKVSSPARLGSTSPVPHESQIIPLLKTSPSQCVAANNEGHGRPASRASSIHDILNPTSPVETLETPPARPSLLQHDSCQPALPINIEQHGPETTLQKATTPEKTFEGASSTVDELGSQQGSGKKRMHDEMIGAGTIEQSSRASGKQGIHAKEPIARSSSFVRLAMTSEGAVKVRTNNEPTPSPEKPRAGPPPSCSEPKAGLARSRSAVNSIEAFRVSSQGRPSKPFGAGFGRSRDARTWEFYCDSSARDALSKQAEAETSGSAVSAINLIRSNSFKGRSQPLSPSLIKTNHRGFTNHRETKPKARLSRTQSSLGRLQGYDGSAEGNSKGSQPRLNARCPLDDSDKENWAPGTRLSEHTLRRTQPSGNQRPVLRDSEAVKLRRSQSPGPHPAERPDTQETEGLLGREKAKVEDLDCIQGLLSLSQGAWR